MTNIFYRSLFLELKKCILSQGGSTEDGKTNFDKVVEVYKELPSLGLAYDMSFYANWAQSNRAPSPVELACADPAVPCRVPNAFTADPPLGQVISQGFETGLRGHIHQDKLAGITPLTWSINGYSFENKNDIIFISAGGFELLQIS